MTIEAIIGIGSNLCEPKRQVQRAFQCLSQRTGMRVLAQSSLYISSPQGPQDQDDYCNAVALIETHLTPIELLQSLQTIEQEFGRVKTRRWGERIIDLDIIFYGHETINQTDPDLSIPHPLALKRDFVVTPTLEVAPSWALPDGTPLGELNSSFTSHNLQKLTSP